MANHNNFGTNEAGRARRSARAVVARPSRRARSDAPYLYATSHECANVIVICHTRESRRFQRERYRMEKKRPCAAARPGLKRIPNFTSLTMPILRLTLCQASGVYETPVANR